MILERITDLDEYLVGKVLVVCGKSIELMPFYDYFANKNNIIYFKNFCPNPTFESVEEGVKVFNDTHCDTIVAVGGGSAIDVAKCIKLFSNMDQGKDYLNQEITKNDVPLIAIPTTAGTGSETTKYAVIYYGGEKQSIEDESCVPSLVYFDPATLNSLSSYQRRATLMDAFCHAIEAFWSVNSTDESKEYSKAAIKIILLYYKDYLAFNNRVNVYIMKASYLAGKAINIAKTTACHAMSYKLSSLYNISHGHAVALCMQRLWPFMVDRVDRCCDSRGKVYLTNVFEELAHCMGCKNASEAPKRFSGIFEEFGLDRPMINTSNDYTELVQSVNTTRLKNNPISLTNDDISQIYHDILISSSNYI